MTRSRELAELATAYDTGTPLGFRNRIINGDMRIDQRNAGASVTPANSQYLVDRFFAVLTQASKFSAQQNAGAVTPPAGFTNYQGATSLSAYSILTGDAFAIRQSIEGFNVSDLGWGTASAQAVTISFWVRSSLTGSFGGNISNSAFNRSYPFSYTISAANTWEQKTVIIPGDTTGTWLTTNATGISLTFGLGYGASLSGTAGVWNAGTAFMPTGATSVIGTLNATWYITGVQLEVGSVATPFERRPYGTELALCQRYFIQYGDNTTNRTLSSFGSAVLTTEVDVIVPLPVEMRATPTIVASANLVAYDGVNAALTFTGPALAGSSTNKNLYLYGAVSGATVYRPYIVRTNSSTAGYIHFSAEL